MNSQNVPLPNGWTLRKFGDCARLVNGRAYSQPELLDSGTPVLRIQNLNGGERWYYSDLVLPEEKYCRSGDLLYAWSASFGPYRFEGPRSIFHYHIWRVIPAPDFDIGFAFRLLEWITARVKAAAHGVAMLHMTKAGMESMTVPVPPLSEQRRIAEILDKADALRAKRRAAFAQLDALVHAMFLDVMTASGRTLDTISIEGGMEAIIDYRGKSPTKTERGVPLITARVVKNGELLEPNEFIAEDDYHRWMRRGLPRAGDVVFTTEAPLGEVAQLDGRQVALAQRLLVLRGKPTVFHNTFLKHALAAQDVRRQIDSRATGSTVRGIRQSELRKVVLPMPPIRLQQEFAHRAAVVERLKANYRSSAGALDALFASLQHRAFSGGL